jgi:hypothetical protein
MPLPLYFYRVHTHSMSQQQALAMIRQSQAAVNRALLRRGIAESCELRVEISSVGDRLQSHFSLHPKAGSLAAQNAVRERGRLRC